MKVSGQHNVIVTFEMFSSEIRLNKKESHRQLKYNHKYIVTF